jgi:uncharacterized protein YyaL (SSP411 family)
MASDPQLEQIRQSKQHLYSPRTRHWQQGGVPRFTNRLIREDSPYLLQHAHNPVDWYAWGDAAFEVAKRDNKPVFLSIGYATCHWCHVMEEESFDDLEVARALNEGFISIKVDREQRPDLDDHFMTGVQLISGQGGWPMSSFLTPDAKPFFGATYLPKASFLNLLEQIQRYWRDRPEALIESSERVHQAILAQSPVPGSATGIDHRLVDQVLQAVLASEDRAHGGTGQAPKFAHEPQLLLLLDEVQRAGTDALEQPAWGFVCRALDGMLRGGIFDQVGGGFHRYATDAAWQVPHFEKMLYNQAQLALVYLRAWLLGGNPDYRRVACETLDYVLAEMRSHDGGFYSTTDADSEGAEGRFFTWSLQELEDVLEPRDLAFVQALYGINAAGNFEGRNILHLVKPLPDQVPALAASYEALLERLNRVRAQLYRARQQRPLPLRDDKVITEWNGMMIIALAQAGRLLKVPRYLEAATACAQAIWQQGPAAGELYRNAIHGRASIAATLADYGYYLQALIALYDATADPDWLERALQVQRRMDEHFRDRQDGGFFNTTANAGQPVIGRSKSAMDMTAASGNSAALMGLVLLQQRTAEPSLAASIKGVEACFADTVGQQPLAFPALLMALGRYHRPLPSTLQYGAEGRVRIEASLQRRGVVTVRLQITDGWHLNSHQPEPADLYPTALLSRDPQRPLSQIEYPIPLKAEPGPGQAPLAQYRGEVQIRAQLTDGAEDALHELELRFQACSDSACLAPESVRLLLPRRAADGGC